MENVEKLNKFEGRIQGKVGNWGRFPVKNWDGIPEDEQILWNPRKTWEWSVVPGRNRNERD